MFNVKDSDIDKFDSVVQHNAVLSAELKEGVYSGVREQIAANFKRANGQFGRCVGRYCVVKALDAHVGFVLLCDETDRAGSARRLMMGGEQNETTVYKWSNEMIGSSATTDEQRAQELERLERWMKAKIRPAGIHTFPKETILRRSGGEAVPLSVTSCLSQRFRGFDTVKDGTHLVFVVPVDSNVLKYTAYVRKRITAVLDEYLTSKRDVYIVLDVGADYGVTEVKDIMPMPMPSTEMDAYIAVDPKLAVLPTCAVLHFSFAF